MASTKEQIIEISGLIWVYPAGVIIMLGSWISIIYTIYKAVNGASLGICLLIILISVATLYYGAYEFNEAYTKHKAINLSPTGYRKN